MAYEHFTLTAPNIAYFRVRDVPLEERIAYIDSTFGDWDRYWKTMAWANQRFFIIMNISDLKHSHKASREHMVERLKKVNEAHPGVWAGTAIVASSMLTRGIATAYTWFASVFPGVQVKVFGDDEEATTWARTVLDSNPRPVKPR